MNLIPLSKRNRPQPTGQDLAYRKTTNRLGATLLLFWVLFSFSGLATLPLENIAETTLPTDWAYAAIDLLDSATYLLSFMLPALLFFLITPRTERIPMKLSPVLPKHTPALILMGMAIITCASIINSWLSDLWNYSEFSSDVLWDTSTMQDYEGVLWFISTALVPAFCEEFLFRGVVLNNLMPYGKTTAVLGSALLFGIMHQNIGQLFYATVAGVVLGLLYIESKSIWAPTLLHMMNNLSGVAYGILSDRLSATSANRLLSISEVVITGLGLLALLYWIYHAEQIRPQKKKASVFAAEWDEEMGESQAVTPAFRVRYFLSPMMITFLCFAIVQMIFLIRLAMIYMS